MIDPHSIDSPMHTTPSRHSLPRVRAANGEDRTRALAYLLWEQAGRPEGQDVAFWLTAERQLRENPGTPAANPLKNPSSSNGSTAKRRSKPAAKKAAAKSR